MNRVLPGVRVDAGGRDESRPYRICPPKVVR